MTTKRIGDAAKYQKRVRLKDFPYQGTYRYFLTITTDNRKPTFSNPKIVAEVLATLKILCKSYQFNLWAYCFMPDHLHLLIEGKEEDSDMKRFISMFKQRTSFDFKQKLKKRLWQENYYEHVLRRDEDTKAVAKYILENPVRKELVEDYTAYSYGGSLMFDVKEL